MSTKGSQLMNYTNAEESESNHGKTTCTETTSVRSESMDPERNSPRKIKVNLPDTDDAETDRESTAAPPQPSIAKHAEFNSFLQLRDAIEKYQRENSVQLIVKDSKLLKAESTRKVIPKVYHLVNQELMYHSITYTCKCHGELKQRPGTRVKNVGKKRLNCPMYIRLKLSPDFQKLVLFDLHEEHNHGIDTTTCQMTPRQQVYHLSRLKRKRSRNEEEGQFEMKVEDVADLMAKEEERTCSRSESKSEPQEKSVRLEPNSNTPSEAPSNTEDNMPADDSDKAPSQEHTDRPESPLDSCSSCSESDSDEEEIRNNRRLLPFPIRLIGSAINSNPELIASTKELLEIQKSKLNLEKQKLLMETKLLELTNTKLELEVRQLQKVLSSETSQPQDTTIYLQGQ